MTVIAEPLLRARQLQKSFGPTRALVDGNLTVAAGQIHALLGGNGAGKSTLINIVSGVLQPDSGSLSVAEPPNRHDTSAVAVVHQELAQLPHLTVAENIATGLLRGRVRYRWDEALRRSEQALDMLGVDRDMVHPRRKAQELDLHELQLVEIARALSAGARLILLDEPTASLTSHETERLFSTLRQLAHDGIGLVFVSHRMHEIRQIADVCTVLRDGKTVLDGVALDEVHDDDILAAITPSPPAEAATTGRIRRPPSAGQHVPRESEPALMLRDATSDTTVSVGRGEVLGLAGAPAGPTAVLDTLLGLRQPSAWSATLGGAPFRPRSPRHAVRSGVGFVSGDRTGKGLITSLSIKENLLSARRIVHGQWWVPGNETALAQELLDRLDIKAADLDTRPDTLSGGTQQRVLIARWLSLPLRLLLLEEPTRGVDVHTKHDIYELVSSLTNSGLTVLWWSTEHAELAEICERVLTFTVYGRVADVLAGTDLTENAIAARTGLT